MKILVIEGDDDTASYVAKGLIEQGRVVDHGRDGLFLAAGETYDVLIVDRVLPAFGIIEAIWACVAFRRYWYAGR